MIKIAVFVSGGGTNLQALINAQKDGSLGIGQITLVVSSAPDVFALTRAQNAGIKTITISKKNYVNPDDYDTEILSALAENNIDLVVLAGFLSILGQKVVKKYNNRIINVHPSLIPSFCGKGYYGLKVHKAVLEYGVKVTGATVHFVNEVIDGGKIILQKAIDVLPDDNAESLQQRVMKEGEWLLLTQAVAMFCKGELSHFFNET